jgi:prepilin signal peptidase PulO-like enzyme (type II secretory pathway)
MTGWLQLAAFAIAGLALGLIADELSVRLLTRRGWVLAENASIGRLIAVGGAIGSGLIPLDRPPSDWLFAIGAGCVLLSLTACDLRAHVLPNSLLCLLVSTLFLRAVLVGQLPQHVLGAAAGLALLLLPAQSIAIMLGKSGIGIGDIKLAMILGLLLGWPEVIGAVSWGILCGGVMTLILLLTGKIKIGQPVAYGQFLIMGGWLFWTLGKSLPFLN